MRKQRGGLILPYKDSEKSSKVFKKYLENSDIKFLTSGSYGITFVATLRPSSVVSPDEMYKQLRPDDKYGSPVDTLLIKLCIINTDLDYFKLGTDKYNVVVEIATVTESDFQNEINIQTEVYLKTLQYLQPLCPGIVYSDIMKGKQNYDPILLEIIDNGDTYAQRFITGLISNLAKNPDVGVGILGMEFLKGGDTIFGQMQKSSFNKGVCEELVRFSVLKLALDTGYNHSDFHTSNIMIVPDDNYTVGGRFRPIVIDYGRAIKIPQDIMEKIKENVKVHTKNVIDSSYNYDVSINSLNKYAVELTDNYMVDPNNNYVKALELLCHHRATWETIVSNPKYSSFYGIVCGKYGIEDDAYLNELANALFETDNKLIMEYNEGKMKQDQKPLRTLDELPYMIDEIKKQVRKNSRDINYDLVNEGLGELFQKREQQIDINIKRMNELHDREPSKYPLIPVSNAIKNSLYNGMIGGKMKSKTKRRHIKMCKKTAKRRRHVKK